MSSILFLIDNFEGHIIPSFKLACSLKEKGHNVIYVSVVDLEKMVREQGFDFYPLFDDIYSQGFNRDYKNHISSEVKYNQMVKTHLGKIMNGELDAIIKKVNPALIIVSVFLRMEAILLYYKYGIRPVILTTYLREPKQTFIEECVKVVVALPGDAAIEIVEYIKGLGVRFSSLRELLQPAATFQELIVCPKEFDMNDESAASETGHYIGPSILQQRSIGDKPDFTKIKKGSKVIYASLGSFVLYREACGDFFKKMVQIMRDEKMNDFHLILAVGLEFDVAELHPIPENMTVMRWASQIDILKIASLMVTHGGLGTIKECIYYGVPMIVIPLMYDQFRNATLVDHHQVGISKRLEDLSIDALKAAILQVVNDEITMSNIKKMQSIFQEREASQSGVEIIEHLLLKA